MDKLYSFIRILLLLTGIIMFGCVESGVDNPNDKVTITLLDPTTGDTVQVGSNFITYKITNPARKELKQFEVIINNGDFVEIFEAEGNSNETPLYLNIDSSLLFTRISYFVNVATTENKYTTSEVQERIYVQENTSPPRAPINLRLTKLDGNATSFSVNLEWDDSSDNESNYELWRKEGADGSYGTTPYKIFPANTERTNDDGLSRFITYYYKVSAKNKFGRSPFSNEVSTADDPDEAPTNLTATALGATNVQLNWDDNPIPKLGYRIQRSSLTSTDYRQIAIVSNKEYLDEGLIANTTYSYRVQSFTSTSESEWSTPANVTTLPEDIPPPKNLKATFDSTARNVVLEWTDDTFYEDGTFIERKRGASGSYTELAEVDANVTTFTDNTVVAGNTYYYRARHYTTYDFYTDYSNEAVVIVPELPPNPPTNLRISEVDTNLYLLNWEDNSSDEDGFQLWRQDGVNDEFFLYKSYPPNTIADNVLLPDNGLTYYFKVRSYRGELTSEFSNTVGTDGTSGSDRIILTAESRPNNSILLEWTDIVEPKLGFSLERKLSWQQDSEYRVVKQSGPNTFQYLDERLNFGVTYTYRIRAIFNQGYSEYSDPVTQTPGAK